MRTRMRGRTQQVSISDGTAKVRKTATQYYAILQADTKRVSVMRTPALIQPMYFQNDLAREGVLYNLHVQL